MKGSSTGADKTQGLPQGRVKGSSRAGGPTEIDSMGGGVGGSNVAGKAMVHVGGANKGSTYPNAMKGGSKPSGTSRPNVSTGGSKVKGSSVAGLGAKIAKFHQTRGASKL